MGPSMADENNVIAVPIGDPGDPLFPVILLLSQKYFHNFTMISRHKKHMQYLAGLSQPEPV